jgi:hypothetical protein
VPRAALSPEDRGVAGREGCGKLDAIWTGGAAGVGYAGQPARPWLDLSRADLRSG